MTPSLDPKRCGRVLAVLACVAALTALTACKTTDAIDATPRPQAARADAAPSPVLGTGY